MIGNQHRRKQERGERLPTCKSTQQIITSIKPKPGFHVSQAKIGLALRRLTASISRLNPFGWMGETLNSAVAAGST